MGKGTHLGVPVLQAGSLGMVHEGARIRLTKKTDVRKSFGTDFWEQPIPRRRKVFFSLQGPVLQRCEGAAARNGVGLSHVNEPQEIG